MPDIFDFISTRFEPSNVSLSPSLPDLGSPKLLGQVPAYSRNAINETLPKIDQISQRINNLPNNKPAYSYTQGQEKRYSNPNLQFTPYTTLGTDIEDIYGRRQGAGEQLWNSLLKTGATAGATFVSSFLTIPELLDLIRSGKYVEAFNNDSLFAGIQNWLTSVEDDLPNYYTEWERNNPYYSAITPTGAANFWGDKVIKNIGFTIGALGAGIVQDAAIEFLSGGAATPATFLALANQIRKVPSNLFKGFRDLTKIAQTAEGLNNAMGVAKTTKSLYKGLSLASLENIGKASRFITTSYLSAQGESFIEGYHTYLDVKKDLIQSSIDKGEKITPELMLDIEKRAQDAGRWTTGLNLPVLMASNMVQFSNLLYGKAAFGETIPFLKTSLTNDGLKITSDFTLKKGLKEWAKESFKDSLSEGGEEAAQYFIGNSMHDYYVDRMNPEIKGELLNYTLNNAKNILDDPQLYQEAFLGGLSGFIMGAPVSIPNLLKSQYRYDSLASNLNSVYNRFNSTVKNFASTIELNNVPEQEKHIAAHKNLYTLVHDSLKYGTIDTFKDALDDLKTVDLDSFNQTFNTDFKTEAEKQSFVNSLIDETSSIVEDVKNTERFFPTNPYSKPFLWKKISDSFSNKSERELENIRENLFSDFKEVVGYNQSLLRVTKNRSLLFQNELKTLGVKNESIGFLGNIANPKGLFQYSKWKKEQIKNLSDQLQYYNELGALDLNTKEEKDKIEKELKRSSSFYNLLDNLYQQLRESPKNKELQSLINSLVLREETNEEQLNKFKEEITKKTEELQKTESQAESLKKEEEDLFSDESKTAEKIIDLNNTSDQLAQPSEIEPVPTAQENPNKWINDYSLGQSIYAKGIPFEIVGKTSDSLIVKDEHGQYVVRKEGNKWILKGQSNLYHLNETTNKIETDSLEQDPVDEYLSDAEPIPTELPPKVPTLTIGETFSASDVFKSNNTLWIRAKDKLETTPFIYSMENSLLVKRVFYNQEVTSEIKGRFYQSETLPPYLQGEFKQVLRDDEQPFVSEPVLSSNDKNLKSFLKDFYENEKLRNIFVSNIENNIFELDC